MPNALPWYKRRPRDFFEGTVGMSFEDKAAYGLLLDIIYMRGGDLPDDARYISGLLGASVRKWNAIRARLIETGKIDVIDGLIRNQAADRELKKTTEWRDRQSDNARSSGDNPAIISRISPDDLAETNPKINENSDVEERPPTLIIEPEPEPDIETSSNEDVVARTPAKPIPEKPNPKPSAHPIAADWSPTDQHACLAIDELKLTETEYADAISEFVDYWRGEARTKHGRKTERGWNRAFTNRLRDLAARWRTQSRHRVASQANERRGNLQVMLGGLAASAIDASGDRPGTGERSEPGRSQGGDDYRGRVGDPGGASPSEGGFEQLAMDYAAGDRG